MRAIVSAALFASLAVRPVHADDAHRIDATPRWEGAFGFRVGSFHVGSFDGLAFGLHLDGGIRFDKLQLLGEYSFMSISQQPPTDNDAAAAKAAPTPAADLSGIVQRVGLDARYSVAKIVGEEVPLRGDFWLEGGFGEQVIRWELGGELHRPDVSFGFGGQFSARFGEHHDHHVGVYYAFKALLAHGPASYVNSPPTCAGPCDTATRPIGIDRSLMFNFGLVFGN